MKQKITLKLFAALLFINIQATFAQDVLIIYDDSPTNTNTLALKSHLESEGFTVTISSVDETLWDGTNPALTGFEAVIHLNGTTYGTEMPVAGQTALKNFVEVDGGLYVGFEWNAYEVEQGRMLSMTDLILMNRVNGGGVTSGDVVTAMATHPVLEGVPSNYTFASMDANLGTIRTFSTQPSEVLVKQNSNTEDAVAIRHFGKGHILGMSYAANYASNAALNVPEIKLMITNFLKFYSKDKIILLIYDVNTSNANTLSLKTALETAGHSVMFSTVAETAWDNTNPSVNGFDAVIHLNGDSYGTEMPVGGQTALVNFVDGGGRYVGFEWNAYEISVGQMLSMRDLVLYDRTSSSTTGTITTETNQTLNPIMNGVPTSYTPSNSASINTGTVHTFGTYPVQLLASQGTEPIVMTRDFNNGYVLNIAVAANYNSSNILSEANIQKMVVNFMGYTGYVPPVGIADNDKKDGVQLINNITSDFLFVKGVDKKVKCQITNMIGQNILTTELNKNQAIDVTSFKSGIYLISFDNSKASKFVKN